MKKISIKREQSQAGLSFAEREKFRPQVKNKLLLLLVLLMTAATGAVAQEPELLVTIESNGNGTSSKTFDGKAILTFGGGRVSNDNDNWGWFNYSTGEEISLTVTGADGYTVTSCTFYTKSSSKTVEGEHPTVYVTGSPSHTYTATGKGGNDLGEYGVTKIEVYGYAPAPTYAITLAEGTEDADKWSISPNPAEEGATVTATYSGDKKVKSVKAVKKPEPPIFNPVVGQIIGSDGKNYDANATLPTGVTAVAKICYVGSETGVEGYTNGLALALNDKGEMIWSEATGTSGAAAHTPAAPTNTSSWMLPSRDQWNKMINAAGGYTALRDGFSGITGASNLQSDGYYWSSTEYSADRAWRYDFDDGIWSNNDKYFERQVRACLAF